MALKDGFPSASGNADALDLRLGLAGLIVRDPSGNPRTGVLPRHTNALVTSTATMNSSVAAAEFVLSRTGQGVIFIANDGSTNVLHDAAPAANSRYDTIWVKQNDAVSPNADADNLPTFGIVKGTPSPAPTLPTYSTAKATVPAGAEPLAAVLIPSTATSMQSAGVVYTQLFRYTATQGGVIPFRTTVERDAGSYVKSQLGFLLDANQLLAYDGAAWVSIGAQPFCVLRKTANQNLTTSPTALVLDVEISDTSGMHDNVTNNTRIIAPVAGVYEFTASVYNNNTSGLGTIQARLNGATDIPGSLNRRTADAAALPLLTTFTVVMAAGEYVEIMVLHATAAGNIAGGTANGSALVTAKRIGA